MKSGFWRYFKGRVKRITYGLDVRERENSGKAPEFPLDQGWSYCQPRWRPQCSSRLWGGKGFGLGCIKSEISGKHCTGGMWIYVSGVQQSDLDWGCKLESCWHAAAAAKSLQSYPTLCDPIDGSPPGSPSLGFSRQEHWNGLPFPSPMHESEKWK